MCDDELITEETSAASNECIELVVGDTCDEKRIDRWLAAQLPGLTRARIQALIEAGFITTGADRRPIVKVSAKPTRGMRFTVCLPPPEPVEPQPEAIPLEVIFEDEHIIAVNKPPGLVVHPSPGHSSGTLVNALLHHCKHLGGINGALRPGIVHRLDRETSGVLIAAKTDAAMQGLTRAFHDHTLTKEYRAIVHGVPNPASGRLETLIGRHPTHRQKMANVERNGKRAVTNYRLLRAFQMPARVSHVKCIIETGRTHQIRVHLSAIGNPILGDGIYGSSSRDKALAPTPSRHLLHAFRLPLTTLSPDRK